MNDRVSYRHRDYELHCGAKVLDNGKFAPTLLVIRQGWPSRPREVAVSRGDYGTEEAAVQAAHVQGVDWIANYG